MKTGSHRMSKSKSVVPAKDIAIDTIELLTLAAGLVSTCSIAGAKTAATASAGITTKEGALVGAAIGIAATVAVVWVFRRDVRSQIVGSSEHFSPVRFPIN